MTCHDCNTLATSECLDKFETSHSTDCEETDNKCAKYKTVSVLADRGSMWGDKSYASAVTRGCLQSDVDDGCITQRITGGYAITCICSGDDCNAAIEQQFSQSLLLFCLIISVIVITIFAHWCFSLHQNNLIIFFFYILKIVLLNTLNTKYQQGHKSANVNWSQKCTFKNFFQIILFTRVHCFFFSMSHDSTDVHLFEQSYKQVNSDLLK